MGPAPSARTVRLDLDRPRAFGELLRTALQIFGRHADILLTLALVLVAPVTLVVDGIWGHALADGADANPSVTSQGVSAAISVFVILPVVVAANALFVRDLGEGTPPGPAAVPAWVTSTPSGTSSRPAITSPFEAVCG